MPSKRSRKDEYDNELFDSLAALIRQGASRAIERARLCRMQALLGSTGSRNNDHRSNKNSNTFGNMNNNNNNSSNNRANSRVSMQPIDHLLIQYCMYYLDASGLPPRHYVRLAQEQITSSPERLLSPALFSPAPSLPQLVEGLLQQHDTAEMVAALAEVDALLEVRNRIGEWLSEAAEEPSSSSSSSVGEADGDGDGEGSGGVVGKAGDGVMYEGVLRHRAADESPGLTLGVALHNSLEYWVRVGGFLRALTEGKTDMTAVVLQPPYERQLMTLLHELAAGPQKETTVKNAAVKTQRQQQQLQSGAVKTEALDEEEEGQEEGGGGGGAGVPELKGGEAVAPIATAVLGDALALSHCADDNPRVNIPTATAARLRQISPAFYRMVHARLGIMVSRDTLRAFGARARCAPPALVPAQAQLDAELHAGGDSYARAMETGAPPAAEEAAEELMEVRGMPADMQPDMEYFQRVMRRHRDTLGEDEEIYVPDQQQQQLLQQNQRRANARRQQQQRELVKPTYYGKIRKGYSWSAYNRTHYDRGNPPPQTVLGYEFVIFYPLLAQTKKDMRRIFSIRPIDKSQGGGGGGNPGEADENQEYCVLVFHPGPPYEDLAVRIQKRAWDRRRGGTRISFDDCGIFKLSFRFSNSNFRR